MNLFSKSVKAKSLYFLAADVILLLFLLLVPMLIGVILNADPVVDFVGQERSELTLADVPENLNTMMAIFLIKAALLFLIYAVGAFFIYIFTRTYAWNLFYDSFPYAQRVKTFSKMVGIWFVSMAVPFVLVFLGLGYLSSMISTTTHALIGYILWLFMLAVLLWFAHATFVLHATIFKGGTITKAFHNMHSIGLQGFHKMLPGYGAMFIIYIAVITILGFFIPYTVLSYVGFGLLIIYLAWARSYVAVQVSA